MTRLEQSLSWWLNSRHKSDSVPERHYKMLKKHKCILGSVENTQLSDSGNVAITALKQQKKERAKTQNRGGVVLNLWENLDSSQENLDHFDTIHSTHSNAKTIQLLLNKITCQKWTIKLDVKNDGLFVFSEKEQPLTQNHWLILLSFFSALQMEHSHWYLLPDEIYPALDTLLRKMRKKKSPRKPQKPAYIFEGVTLLGAEK